MSNEGPRYRCDACGGEWNSVIQLPERPTHCPVCGARQLCRVVGGAVVYPGAIDAALAEMRKLFEQHAEDLTARINGLLHGAMQPPIAILVEFGTVGDSGLGWAQDRDHERSDLTAFLAKHPGARLRVSWEVIDEPRDTERPPPLAGPIGENLDELDVDEAAVGALEVDESTVTTLGRMVGPDRAERAGGAT